MQNLINRLRLIIQSEIVGRAAAIINKDDPQLAKILCRYSTNLAIEALSKKTRKPNLL
jgi:hypothetical protein